MEEKAHWLTHSLTYWINDEAVYRTAPATPGLLIITIALQFIEYITQKHSLASQRRILMQPQQISPAKTSPLNWELKWQSQHFKVKIFNSETI